MDTDATLRDLLLEASDEELRAAVTEAGGNFEALADAGRVAATRALGQIPADLDQTRRCAAEECDG